MERVTGDLFAVKSTEDCCCSNSNKHKSIRSDGEDQDLGVAAAGNNSLAALENEIQMLQDLESEFVVRCLGSDWSEEGGKRMRNLFLEYMPGGCLSELLKQFFASTDGAGTQQQEQQPLVLDEHLIRSYTRSLVKAIHYLHCRGIVHCDIKGKNVLVGNAGTVKLADFGSAKRISNGPGQSSCCTALPGVLGEQEQLGLQQDAEAAAGTMENKVNGTPLWMAPEVVLQKEQGFPSDIWSLGCTVVEMATGRAPWAHIADPFVALYRIGCSEEVPQTPASLSPEAQDFLAHCFQRDPRKRWTAAKLLQHPFLTGGKQAPPTCCLDGAAPPPPPRRLLQQQLSSCKAAASPPASPTSVLELDHHDSTSTLVLSSSSSSSTPLVSTPSTFFWKKLAALESPRRPSQQVEEAGATRSSSGSIIKDWWDSSSPLTPLSQGEWIVVRSPKASPKRLESPPPPPHRLADAASAQKDCKSSPAEEEEEEEEIACRGASSTASSLLPPAAAAVAAPSACTTATATAAESRMKQNFLQILHKAESANSCSNKTGAPSPSTFFFGSLLQHHPNLQIPQKNPVWMKKPDSSSGPNSMQDHHQILDQSVCQKIIDSTDWTQQYLSSAIDKSQRRRTRRRRRRRRRGGGGGAPLEAAHQRRCLQQPPRRSRRRRTHIDKNISLPCFSEYKQHLDKISQDLSNDLSCIQLQLMSKSDTGSQFIQEKDCLCVCVCACVLCWCMFFSFSLMTECFFVCWIDSNLQ
jgi:serine/threonine protein kinase